MKKLNSVFRYNSRFTVKKYFTILFTFVAFVATFLISGSVFSEYYEQFFVDTSVVNATLKQLESKDTPFTVYFNPEHLPDEEGENKYSLNADYNCSEYVYNEETDEDECVDPVLDLCPYISITPVNGEDTESGFSQIYHWKSAKGQLSNPSDMVDNWTISITSPCFEGECPADYNQSQNGAPLSQSQKGKTFKCDISAFSNSIPVLMKNYVDKHIAYASEQLNTISVSAVLTGETQGCTVDCYSNVLFLPGLEASRLYKQGTLGEDRLWEPNINSDVIDLYLDQNGNSVNDVYTRDVIDKGLGFSPVYDSFLKKMHQLSNSNNFSFEYFAYDWRQDVEDIVNNGTKYENENKSLITTLENLVNSSPTGKVTIIAHSNGGLLVKGLLVKLQELKNNNDNNLIDNIDSIILVASPQIGTPVSIAAILHGYGQTLDPLGFLLNTQTARQFAVNMPSGYGLLPSDKYYQTITNPVITFDTSSSLSQIYRNYYGDSIDSFDEQNNFLLGKEGRLNPSISDVISPTIGNEYLLNKSKELHNKIDNLIIPPGIKLIQLSGWGKDTLIGFKYVEKYICYYPDIGLNICIPKKILDVRPVTDMDGDKTVVSKSALYDYRGDKYWLDLSNSKLEHKNIFEDSSVLQFIENILTNKSIDVERIYQQKPIYSKIVDKISVHSPVTLGVYDSQGNFTGKLCSDDSDFCQIVEDIPNSTYMEFGEGKYININEDNINKIVLQGTDIGTFTYESERVLPDGTSTTSSFVDIPVTTQTQAEILLNPNTQILELNIDVTGDGTTDFTLTPSDTFDPVIYLQIMKSTIGSLDIHQAKIKAFNKRVDNLIKLIQKGKIGKAELKAEKFKNILENKLSKPDPKHSKVKKLSKTDAQLLLDMLNKLLDNIN